MSMKILREGAMGGILKYVLFTLLLLAVFGLVLLDLSGAYSGNVSGNRDLAKIEDHMLTLPDFDGTVRRTLGQMGISPQQAYELGFINQILAQEVRSYLAMVEAEKLGVNLSDDFIKKNIAEAVKPLVGPGQTLQEAFENSLRAQNLTEKQFVAGIRRQLTGEFITRTTERAFFGADELLARDILAFQSQTRDVEVLLLPDTDIKDIPEPKAEQLETLYNALKDSRFGIPEYREIKLGVYAPDPAAPAPEISEAQIKNFYDQNIARFAVTEQKLLTQALFQDAAMAQKVMDAVNAGQSFEAAYETITQGKNGPLASGMRLEVGVMFPDMRDALDKAQIGQVVGPITTPLGVHLIRLEGSVPPSTRPLSEVSADIKAQLAEEAKGRQIYELSNALQDHFLEGGRIADSKDIVALKPISLPALERTGKTPDGKDAFAGLDASITAVKDTLLQEAFTILTDDTDQARIVETPEGFIAVELVKLTPAASKPYDAVKEEVRAQYNADMRAAANTERTAKLLAALKDGSKKLSDIAKDTGHKIETLKGISVAGVLPPPLNDEIRPSLFKEPVGSFLSFQPENAAALIHITGFTLPEITPEQEVQIPGMLAQINQEMKNEAVLFTLESLSNKYQARVNETLLKRAYGSAPADSAESP